MCGLLSFVSLALLVVGGCTSRNWVGDIEPAKAAGQPIVRKLQAYKDEHGRYPESLQQAGAGEVTTALGVFEYERRSVGDDEFFVLFVGDYSRNGFVLFWNSDMTPQEWIVEE